MRETSSIHQRAATLVGRSCGSAHSYREPLKRAAGILPAGRALGPADKMSAARWFMTAMRGSRIVEAAHETPHYLGKINFIKILTSWISFGKCRSFRSNELDKLNTVGCNLRRHQPAPKAQTVSTDCPPLCDSKNSSVGARVPSSVANLRRRGPTQFLAAAGEWVSGAAE